MAVPPHNPMILRVHITTDIARKMTIASRPQSVDELKKLVQDKFNFDFNFTLQYEDPDFDGQLCVLYDIEELPQKAVIKVVRSDSDASSNSTADTEILSTTSSTPDRLKKWPDSFPVPTFSHEVEFKLRQGHTAFDNTGKTTTVTRSQRHDILENMAATIYSFKAYPSGEEIGKAAEALITTHPCLRESGSRTGFDGWKTSLKFKMGNYRTKLSKAGCPEVAVNAGKRSRNNPERESPHSNIKRPRRAEVNYLPNFPKGEYPTSLQRLKLQIIEEIAKTERNLTLIEKLMQMTFALRRQEIVSDSPPVKEILENWPALRTESQVCSEFQRITNINLRNRFYSELDTHTPRLMTLYRQKAARSGKTAEALMALLKVYDLQEHLDVNSRRTTALRALPVFLREDDSQFFKTWNMEESDEPDVAEASVALLTVVNSTRSSYAIVLEGDIVARDLPTLTDAFQILFGLVYALHLSYPKGMTHTFEFIQTVLMGLDDGKPLKPKLQSLKNDLTAPE